MTILAILTLPSY